MNEKFVIITNQRSGSNMLVSMLDNHSQITCFGELMRATPQWMKTHGYRGALQTLEYVDKIYKDDQYRFAHPYDFVMAVFDTALNNMDLCGFKMHLRQHADFLLRLIHDPEWKLIVLERKNKLAQFSSNQIAKATGQGNAPKGTKVKKVKVEFKANEFSRFVKRETEDWENVRAEIAKSGKEHFSIHYTQILSENIIKDLLTFLGVDSSVKLEPGTEKRNPSFILSRFSNSNEAKQAIDDMGCPQWARENIRQLI